MKPSLTELNRRVDRLEKLVRLLHEERLETDDLRRLKLGQELREAIAPEAEKLEDAMAS